MPEICRFYGILIKMYFADHAPPHFHAYYGEYAAVIDIRTFAVLKGNLPPRALGMATEWAAQHQQELLILWERASHNQTLYKLPPLQ